MPDDFCQEHCMMKEHVSEAPEIRRTVTESKTKIDNLEGWLPKVEAKVDAVPSLLNGFYLKTVFTIGGLNLGTLIIAAIVMFVIMPKGGH